MYRILTPLKKNINFPGLIFISVLVIVANTAYAEDFSEEQLRWLNSDDEKDASEVNEGKLVFLTSKPGNSLHSFNQITISENSLEDGWVSLKQCYFHLDALPEVDITYQYRFIKDLKILTFKNIEKALVKDQVITLIKISQHAEVCVSAKVRIFYQNPDLSFSLVNGPYHRRFLDGYYPYHVTLDVTFPHQLLSFIDTKPTSQPGLNIAQQDNRIILNTFFEGILNTEIIFSLKQP